MNNAPQNSSSLRLVQDSRLNVRMSSTVLEEIMHTIGARTPETGGLLLGPVDRDVITHFHFDNTARCTGSTYTPDHVSLRKKMREDWLPNGVDMKGFAHSHPRKSDCLSMGDLSYITRLLKANKDMDRFVAPVILTHEFCIRVFVILRDDVQTPRLANVTLF